MYISILVSVAGLCSLGVEMTALTLLAPFYGTTQIIWASVIGATLLYLAVGYLLGGRCADRWPELRILTTLLALAGLAVSLVPMLSRPVLLASVQSHALAGLGLGLVACLAILAPPLVLLGMASPYALKLAIRSVNDAGTVAGKLFAFSTLGSILGTFLPVLFVTPWLGTAATFQVLGFVLSLAALPGLLRCPQRLWLLSLAGMLLQGCSLMARPGTVRTAEGGAVIYETQTPYNYIQVRQRSHPAGGEVRQLYLNESWAAHSVYNSRYETTQNAHDLLVHTYWDYVPITPFLYPNRREGSIRSLAMVGLGAGTIPQLFLALYGSDSIVDAAEIDPGIIQVGRRFFGMKDGSSKFPNFQVAALDGRVYINRLERQYDLIVIDCYRWPYVPSHLVTRECFQQARRHLNPQGTLVVKCDRGLMGRRITATLKGIFPQVYQVLGMSVALNEPVGDGLANLEANSRTVRSPVLRQIMREALSTRSDRDRPLQEWLEAGPPLTDDHAPTEFLVHQGALLKLIDKETNRMRARDAPGSSLAGEKGASE